MVDRAPDLLRRIVDEGHSVGTHSQTHPHLAELSTPNAIGEIEAGFNSARNALPPSAEAIRLFRPPYLEDTADLADYLKRSKIANWKFGWLFDDWTDIAVRDLVENVIRRARSERRGVIVLHDIFHVTVRALPLILEGLDDLGFKFVRVRNIAA